MNMNPEHIPSDRMPVLCSPAMTAGQAGSFPDGSCTRPGADVLPHGRSSPHFGIAIPAGSFSCPIPMPHTRTNDEHTNEHIRCTSPGHPRTGFRDYQECNDTTPRILRGEFFHSHSRVREVSSNLPESYMISHNPYFFDRY